MVASVASSKSLIVGASGQVGSALVGLLGPERCVGTTWGETASHYIPFNLADLDRDPSQAVALLEEQPIQAIYCCGGMTNVEGCESQPELTFRVNCEGPAALARLAASRATPFVFFSTEYVFDGTGGPYAECAFPRPISVYGSSKYQAERAVLSLHPQALVVRTTVVYGPDPGAKNFVYGLRRALLSRRRFRVPSDQISTPTYNRDLALAVTLLVDSGVSGIVHVTGSECLSRLEFARRVAGAMGLDPSTIEGVPTVELGQRAPRPLRAGLLTDRLRSLLPTLGMRTVEDSILDWQQTTGFEDVS